MFQSGSLSLTHYQPNALTWKDFHEEISNPNPESEQNILQDMADGAVEGASKRDRGKRTLSIMLTNPIGKLIG